MPRNTKPQEARRYVSMHDLRRLRDLVQHLHKELGYAEKIEVFRPFRHPDEIKRDANSLERVLDTVCELRLQR